MLSAAPLPALRRWSTDLLVFVLIALIVSLLFALTPIDLAAERFFYQPIGSDHWPLGRVWPWTQLYRLAPWVTASLVTAGLLGLLVGVLRHRESWRWRAIFVLLSVVIGPGLLINVLFKDHWNRPRPRDVIEFAGPLPYVAAPLRGEAGASFPCGHCSVGYLYGLGWWLWRRRRPRWAAASLAVGLLAGSLLGIGRMAAGAHFPSDVVWAAVLAFAVAHALYHYVLRLPMREGAENGARLPAIALAQRGWLVAALAGGVLVLLALFALPHGSPLFERIALASLPVAPQAFAVTADRADVELRLVDETSEILAIDGELHGFGLPGSRLGTHTEFDAAPIPTLRFSVEERGWFTDLDGRVSIRLPVAQLQRVSVRVGRGNIRIIDETRGDAVRGGRLRLDAHTGAGIVSEPAPPQR